MKVEILVDLYWEIACASKIKVTLETIFGLALSEPIDIISVSYRETRTRSFYVEIMFEKATAFEDNPH